MADAVALTPATREHRDVRQGSSVRGAIDLTLVAEQPALLRSVSPGDRGAYGQLVYDSMILALSRRIVLDEAADTTPADVLLEIWEDRFVLRPVTPDPG